MSLPSAMLISPPGLEFYFQWVDTKISVENIANEAIRKFMPPDRGYFQERQIFFELGARKFFPSNWEMIYLQIVFITQAKLCAT
jgi:hypothetical protein